MVAASPGYKIVDAPRFGLRIPRLLAHYAVMYLRAGLSRVTVVVLACLLAGIGSAVGQEDVSLGIRFVDAETGFDVDAAIHPGPPSDKPGVALRQLPDGRRVLAGPSGRHELEIFAPGYRPTGASIELSRTGGLPILFRLEPEQRRPELAPESILPRTRPDTTLFLGFVGDDDRGRPLANVRVRSLPSGVETATDDAGYFELHVPLPKGDPGPAQLLFERPGYQSEIRHNLELWPGGDWTYRVRLSRGAGERMVDEQKTRRWSGAPRGGATTLAPEQPIPVTTLETASVFQPASTGPSILTVRVPRTIRVLYTNVVFYETMEGYCRHVLPNEWISSWGSYTGGSNSLQAGAVALRTYAIGYVNQPSAANYDICATTSCQVYNPSVSNSRTDLAVNQTAGFVMINSSANIPRGLTEYSSENNQLGMACGDGFTAPTGGCLADPVCAGEPEFGHGRGMCQWGTVKWATGLKFPGNDFSNTTLTNGQPRRDWVWIAQHYYPNLTLVKGAPLVIGDDVRATTTVTVRSCPDNSITNGVNCPQVGTAASGATGVIVDGPQQVTSDGAGHTWYFVQWTSGVSGWVVENYLARIVPAPPAPTNLVAVPSSPTRIDLSWTDNSAVETGYKVEQANTAGGPWTQIGVSGINTTNFPVSSLVPQTTYYFRIRATNPGGDSGYSPVAFATTPPQQLVIQSIPDQVINEGQTLALTAVVSNAEQSFPLTDFESFAPGAGNGTLLFRLPNYSGSTVNFLDSAPNLSVVTNVSPPGNTSSRALAVSWSFSSTNTNPWLRLTTFGTTTLPNPVIDFTKRFRFDIHASRPLRVALGLRETTNAPGTPLGSNGGSTGGIEWVGVTNRLNSQPQPTRLVGAGAWTTLTFDLPSEPALNFTSANGVLSTASGLGVLEHLAFVPADGAGTYTVFLDNFAVVQATPIAFTLEPGAPAGSAIDSSSGAFTWSPTEAQGPSSNSITVRATDNSVPPQTGVRTFAVTVNEVNQAPALASPGNWLIHALTTLVVTNAASDPDFPANALTFSLLGPVPPGASVHPDTGIFTWTPSDFATGTTNTFALRVADSGAPSLNDTRTFTVRVLSRPILRVLSLGETGLTLQWDSIPGRHYQVQFKTNLSAAAWEDMGQPVTAGQSVSSLDVPPGPDQTFYRILLVD